MLPVMACWIHGNPLEVALRALVEFCFGQWKEEYRALHSSLEWDITDSETTGWYQTKRHEQALKWLRKRDILFRAIADIKAADK